MPSLIDNSGNLVYFGRLTWANLLDWLVTFCLGGILVLTTVTLGGVRPDTHVLILPLFVVLLGLHGLWFLAEREGGGRLSVSPLLFVPFLVWCALSAGLWSPAPWRGWEQVIFLLEAFVFLWVLSNNVRTRAHLWVFLFIAGVPVGYAAFMGFYQFFQNPYKVADAMGAFPVVLDPAVYGRALGSFADPHAFAVLLLLAVPFCLFAGAAPRLTFILRVLSYYIALVLSLALVLVNVFWPLPVLLLIYALVPYLAKRRTERRLRWVGVSLGLLVVVGGLIAFFHPRSFEQVSASLLKEDGAQRWILWQEGVRGAGAAPIQGSGAGSYAMESMQREQSLMGVLPSNPLSDAVWVLTELGGVGLFLVVVPVMWILLASMRRLKAEPYVVWLKVRGRKRKVMPPRRLFISMGIVGGWSLVCCWWLNGFMRVPALMFFAALPLAVLIKSCFERTALVPNIAWLRGLYGLLVVGFGVVFYQWAVPQLKSSGLELHARQQLEALHTQNIQVSGEPLLLDAVIAIYAEACALNPRNADAWIGYSAANAQLFFRAPSQSERIGERSVEYAQRAVDLADGYWRGWAQLGVSSALAGQLDVAGAAFDRALELAPNSSNALYYWAAFHSRDAARLVESTEAVERALEIDPENEAARRLLQKLRIL